MAKTNQTVATKGSVEAYFDKIPLEQKRDDCRAIAKLMSEVSGEPAVMWGPAIVGFGTHHYVYDSGREGDICKIGFAARKQNIVLYIVDSVEKNADDLKKLGKFKTGKGCIYINKLDDIDTTVLKNVMKKSLKALKVKN